MLILLVFKNAKIYRRISKSFFQIGIAEANMMGIAAGLTIGGKIPLQELLLIFLQVVYMIKLDNQLLTWEKC